MTIERVTMSDLGWMTQLLTSAFENIAPATYLFSGANSRAKLAYFMQCGCSYALRCGECYTTSVKDAAALWIPPEVTYATPAKMFRGEMLTHSMHFGYRDLRSFRAFVRHTETVHRAVAEPHYHLLTLAVAPASQGRGAGGRLLRPMLERARNEQVSVFLETQRPENVPMYERFGFEVVSDEPIPTTTGLRNWGMLKRAYA